MKPYYEDNHIRVYNQDCRSMAELPDESVQCVVTSPPFWGLRKYSGEQDLVWGGDIHCWHEWIDKGGRGAHPDRSTGDHDSKGSGIFVDRIARGSQPAKVSRGAAVHFGNSCSLCGAWKGAYGLEPTPEMYIEHTIEILRDIRKVLRKDGVVFWNIGDSYMGGHTRYDNKRWQHGGEETSLTNNDGFKAYGKPKDLSLIPFRVAIAAQEAGWWVRSVIIWSKPNPMPESVTDRPTESHEYILMLTKSARYYWDADAVREAQSPNTHSRGTESGGRASHPGPKAEVRGDSGIASWLQTEANQWIQKGRNIRTVWEFPTQPYPEAHFAVFPERLPEICIKAASRTNDIVLDPFAGAGTTLWIAKKLNRQAVGYEISEEYCQLAVDRIRQQVLEV